MNDFSYIRKLLETERELRVADREWYQSKKPPNCCPSFTLARRQRWADDAIAKIAEIDAALEVLGQKDLESV